MAWQKLQLVLVVIITCWLSAAQAQDAWKATAFGENWIELQAQFQQAVPELADDAGVQALASDTAFWAEMADMKRRQINEAVFRYYEALEKVTPGAYVNRKFFIAAAREVNGYMLLWIEEPGVMDGGRSAIYSIAADKIVGEFSDGGIRG